MRYDGVDLDVSSLVSHMTNDWRVIRQEAMEIVARQGNDEDLKELYSLLIDEDIPDIVRRIIKALITRAKEGKPMGRVKMLEKFLEDETFREDAISLFRAVGETDSLFPLVFDKDDGLVRRVKGYIHAGN
jgi:hypothetical protein